MCSSLNYRIDRGAFEQDVVFTGRLDPADWGFPTNSRIQIITELFSPPTPDVLVSPVYIEENPVVRANMAASDIMDETLSFGELVIGSGKALSAQNPSGTDVTVAAVAKEIKRTRRSYILNRNDKLRVDKGRSVCLARLQLRRATDSTEPQETLEEQLRGDTPTLGDFALI